VADAEILTLAEADRVHRREFMKYCVIVAEERYQRQLRLLYEYFETTTYQVVFSGRPMCDQPILCWQVATVRDLAIAALVKRLARHHGVSAIELSAPAPVTAAEMLAVVPPPTLVTEALAPVPPPCLLFQRLRIPATPEFWHGCRPGSHHLITR
jgi:hypothetical protein